MLHSTMNLPFLEIVYYHSTELYTSPHPVIQPMPSYPMIVFQSHPTYNITMLHPSKMDFFHLWHSCFAPLRMPYEMVCMKTQNFAGNAHFLQGTLETSWGCQGSQGHVLTNISNINIECFPSKNVFP